MAQRDGPGLWWQFLEFMGMTWPGHKHRAAPDEGPPCPACGNATRRETPDAPWRCPHHPNASPQ